MKRIGIGSALLVGFIAGLSLAFTNATTPARAPTVNGTGTAQIYVHDPYVGGAVPGGIPNVTGKPSACNLSQAVGLYDDGGSVGVNCIDISATTAVVTPPAAPTAQNTTTTFDYVYDAGWPAIQYMTNDFWPTPIPVGVLGQAFSLRGLQAWNWRCTRVTATNATVTSTNGPAAVTQNMASGSPTWDGTNTINRIFWVQGTTAASANATNGFREGLLNANRGSVAGTGGFMWWTRVALHKTSATARYAFGLFNTASLLTQTVNPSTLLNTVYFGCDDGDANLSICSNDGSGAATCNTLGTSFPCQTTDATYDMLLSAAPAGSVINYYIERLDSSVSKSGPISSDLPSNLVQLAWQDWQNTGSGTTTVTLYFNGACIVSNF